MSDKIDPSDKSLEPISLEPEGLGKTFGAAALSIAGLGCWPAALIATVNAQFDSVNRGNRIVSVVQSIDANFTRLQSQIGAEREKLKELRERFDAPQFQEAIGTACEEAARTTSTKKIERMIAVVTGSLTPSEWADPKADLATMVRDVAQLSEVDIHVLGVLRKVHAAEIKTHPNLNEPNAFAARCQDLPQAIAAAGIHPDDFYSTCARLAGFGLALEEQRASGTQHHSRCFRPTRRGVALLGYLEQLAS